jgi:hypothetical protein
MATIVDSESDINNKDFLYETLQDMKARYASDGLTALSARNITNQLLQDDFVIKLLNSIIETVEQSSKERFTSSEKQNFAKLTSLLKLKAYIIFFCFYQTQAEEKVFIVAC